MAFGHWWIGLGLSLGLGFSISILASMLGIGGGFVITPWFHSVLGTTASAAVGSSIAQMPLMGVSGLIAYARNGHIRYRHGLALLLGSIPAGQAVAIGVGNIGQSAWGKQLAFGNVTNADVVLLVSYIVFIGGLGVLNIRRAKTYDTDEAPPPERDVPLYRTAFMGTTMGASAALIGIGGGFLCFPYFAYFVGMQPVVAVATSLFAVVITATLTAVRYAMQGDVFLIMSLAIGVGGIAGAQIGAQLASASKPKWIVAGLGWLQIVVAAMYLVKTIA